MIGYSKEAQVGPKKKSQTDKNRDSNKELDRIYAEKGIDYCELKVSPECLGKEKYSNGQLLKLTYAHRHKRIWYKEHGRESLLHSFNETLKACLSCHMMIEPDRTLTNQMFIKLRGVSFGKGKDAR
jgi:hypothetical protein